MIWKLNSYFLSEIGGERTKKTEILNEIESLIETQTIVCPICKNTKVKVTNDIVVLPLWNEQQNAVDNTNAVQAALIVCMRCRHLWSISVSTLTK